MRIGHGYDVHAFAPGDGLWLGGIRVAHEKGVAAHSDGDVVLHALMDALLGAAGLGDIGEHFPNTDERFRDAASSELLGAVMQKIQAKGWQVTNVDITVVAQTPKIAPHRADMAKAIAALLGVTPERVGIKATTQEGLGALGRGEGIAAFAVALLEAAG